ncbi:hypothetical protein B0H13DRAFT_2330463 [Mycena leptocephala]|nr:hypothetical protein B0H13DRAFT_2330463 [Mycena leptocephala]
MTPRPFLPPSRTWCPPTDQHDPHLALHLAPLCAQGPLGEQDGPQQRSAQERRRPQLGSLKNERNLEFAGIHDGQQELDGLSDDEESRLSDERASFSVSLSSHPSLWPTHPSLALPPARPPSPSCTKPTSPPPATSPKSKPAGSPVFGRSEAELASARKLCTHAFEGKDLVALESAGLKSVALKSVALKLYGTEVDRAVEELKLGGGT